MRYSIVFYIAIEKQLQFIKHSRRFFDLVSSADTSAQNGFPRVLGVEEYLVDATEKDNCKKAYFFSFFFSDKFQKFKKKKLFQYTLFTKKKIVKNLNI